MKYRCNQTWEDKESGLTNISIKSKEFDDKTVTLSPKGILVSFLYEKNAESKGYPHMFKIHAGNFFVLN